MNRDHRRPTRAWRVIAPLDAAALALLLAARLWPRFADGYNRTVGAAVRALLAHLTSWLPFSLAEFLLYATLPLLVVLVVYAARRRMESWRTLGVFLLDVVLFFSLLLPVFAAGLGVGYATTPPEERLGLPAVAVDADGLYDTALVLTERLNAAAGEVTFGEDGFSVMPYSLREMNDKLLAAFEPICARYDFLQRLKSRIKPVLASRLMSYTHVTGVYAYFTGEANLNVDFPDYTLPFTAAHELAHQRGVAREQEANFIAFLVCEASDDAYLRYSGTLSLYEYVLSALARTDAARAREALDLLDARVVGELRAYNAFFERYRGAAAAVASDAINDAYLKLNGNAQGSESYALVVQLAVAYFARSA